MNGTRTIQRPLGRGAAAASPRLQLLAHCHAALRSYGAQRLEAFGWRTLEVGSLPAASEGFRKLALGVATGWATYEARDKAGKTIGDLALRQPHWFHPQLRTCIEALSASRLDLYEVTDDGTPLTVLRRLRDRELVKLDAFVDDRSVTPASSALIARVARNDDTNVLIDSAVVGAHAVRRMLRGPAPTSPEDWSRRLLDATLAHFADADLVARGSTLQPALLPYSLPSIGRLHRAMSSLERVLDRRFAPLVRHRMLDGATLIAQRAGRRWQVVLRGPHDARAERVTTAAAHPVDAELMRQIGVAPDEGVLVVDGAIEELARVCAHVATSRAAQAA